MGWDREMRQLFSEGAQGDSAILVGPLYLLPHRCRVAVKPSRLRVLIQVFRADITTHGQIRYSTL